MKNDECSQHHIWMRTSRYLPSTTLVIKEQDGKVWWAEGEINWEAFLQDVNLGLGFEQEKPYALWENKRFWKSPQVYTDGTLRKEDFPPHEVRCSGRDIQGELCWQGTERGKEEFCKDSGQFSESFMKETLWRGFILHLTNTYWASCMWQALFWVAGVQQ